MKNNNQYVIYPHNKNEEEQPNLTPGDKLIYLAIRRSMNHNTMEAFPSYATITQRTGASTKVIKKSIENLEREGYLEVRKEKNRIFYKFNNKKQFEPFSYDFLDNPNLTFIEKSYIVATRQYMFDNQNEGIISYTNKQLSNLIHMPESTISKCNRSLENKGYLNGSRNVIKQFQIRELDLLFVQKFKEQDDRLNEHDRELYAIRKELEQLKEENKALKENRKANFIM